MYQPTQQFKDLIDELALFDVDKDPELAEAFRWLEEEARKLNMNIYQIVHHVLHKAEAIKKARDWMKSK